MDTLNTCELMKAYNVSKLLILDSSIGIEPLIKFDDRFLKKQRKRLNVRYESIRAKEHISTKNWKCVQLNLAQHEAQNLFELTNRSCFQVSATT